MTLVIVPMDVQTDSGDLLVISNVLQIVKNKNVIGKLDNVPAVSLVIGDTRVYHNVRCVVSKEFVTKAMGSVKRDAHQDNMETPAITHVALGV